MPGPDQPTMSSRPNAPDDTNTKMMTTTVASRSRTLRS